jgi:hypothetical protein
LSRALTSYLQINNHFPLVRAQVLDNSFGDRKVILFGFVASTDERITAELRAEEFLSNPWIDIDDQIKIRPELRAAEQQPKTTPPAPSASASDGAGADSAAQPAAQAQPNAAEMPNDIQAYEEQFETEMLGPGLGAFAGVVPFLGAGTLVGLPLFFGIPVIGFNPSTVHPAVGTVPSVAPVGSGLVGAGGPGMGGAGAPASAGAFGPGRPGFETGLPLGHFRPMGGLGHR